MRFPRVYRDLPVEMEGYEGVSFNVLSNPTNRELEDFLNTRSAEYEEVEEAREQGRETFGNLLHLFFGKSVVDSFDFSSPSAALATVESDDLPMDIKFWLKQAPLVALRRYQDDVRSNLFPS